MIDQGSLELLVDGELTDAEQRELLLRLDREPETWRALALAFVEAQRWRKEFQALVADAEQQTSRPLRAALPVVTAKPILRTFGRSMLAVACMLIVLSFAAGHFLGTRGVPRGGLPSQSAGGSSERDLASEAPSGDSVGPVNIPLRAEPLVSENEPTGAEMIMVGVPDSDSGLIRYTALPLVDATRDVHALLDNISSGVPRDLEQMLERNGLEVIRNQSFTPVRLPDGRQAVVVSEYAQVRHVGRVVF